MSAPLPKALRARFQKLVEEGFKASGVNFESFWIPKLLLA